MRQSFLNGSLTRLIDPDNILRRKIIEFVSNGDFGLASGQKQDGTFERIWFGESINPEEVSFESGIFLLFKERAKTIRRQTETVEEAKLTSEPVAEPPSVPSIKLKPEQPEQFGFRDMYLLKLGIGWELRLFQNCEADPM